MSVHDCTSMHNQQYSHHTENLQKSFCILSDSPMYNDCGLLRYASVNHYYLETGYDSFLCSPFQFTVKMELHLTHTMSCKVFTTVPKFGIFLWTKTSLHTTLYHPTVMPYFQTNFSHHVMSSGRCVLLAHSKILIQRFLYIIGWHM